MICEEAEYMHCSMMGSYYIPCVIVGFNVPYDFETHADATTIAMEKYLIEKYGSTTSQGYERNGEIGFLINYQDIVTDEFVSNEWKPAAKIKRYEAT